MDYAKMTDEELEEIINHANKEKATRLAVKKQTYLNNIEDALNQYYKAFGSLLFTTSLGEEYYLDPHYLVYNTKDGEITLNCDY